MFPTCFSLHSESCERSRADLMTSASPSQIITLRRTKKMQYLIRAEPPAIALPGSVLYSPADVERFIRETNLCSNCQTIFGRKDIWRKLRVNYGDLCSYVHHPSIDSLQQSAQAGCQLCIKIHKKWTALDESDEWKSAQNPPISLTFYHYQSGYSRVYRELHFVAPLPMDDFFSYTLIEKDCEENLSFHPFFEFD